MRAETRVEQRETRSKKVVQHGSPTGRLPVGLPCRTTFFESKIESSGKDSSLLRFSRAKNFACFSYKRTGARACRTNVRVFHASNWLELVAEKCALASSNAMQV